MEKRNTAVDLTDLALGVLILGIIVTVGARVLTLYRDSRLTDLPTRYTYNETNDTTVTDLAGHEWDLANRWGISVSHCGNATASDSVLTSATEYLATVDDFGYINVANVTADVGATSINCSYTYYDTTEEQFSLPEDAAAGIGEYGNWFDIIVIVGIAALILSIIFLAFGRREEAGVTY